MSNSLYLDVPADVPWIDFTREFDAPVAAVFDAHRDPDKVRRWLGPYGYDMEILRWDVADGGGYTYIHRDPDGAEYGFRGVFHTVREDELIVQTFEYAGAPDEVALEFLTFEDLGGGRTRLRGRSVGRTVEGRDAMVESGMEGGMREGYVRLDGVLAEAG
ncbi:SRPBCC family protein [uncultured Phycicoccus sp.]|uniref:SRPBCC family protein n=1 Tax=uncultured Phycicoccus sp. TaxID=661422 RepID=UPI0026115867|nr:SRPBCC family protein [uncultured Phycicoccus sp.]